jgi:hemerythrin
MGSDHAVLPIQSFRFRRHRQAGIAEENLMPQATWSPELCTGLAAMDELHGHFCDALSKQASLADDAFRDSYQQFVATLEQAFRTEEQWMEDIEFPSLKSHREQHARVLSALHSTQPMVMEGDLPTARKIVEKLLPEWFIFHASTMNMALAVAIQLADARDVQPAPVAAYA